MADMGLMRLDDGKIAKCWPMSDGLAVYKQLSVIAA